jgi:hypothetical protein
MHTNEQMNTIRDVMYSKLELNLTSSFFSMHSTTEILFDGVDLIYSLLFIYFIIIILNANKSTICM